VSEGVAAGPARGRLSKMRCGALRKAYARTAHQPLLLCCSWMVVKPCATRGVGGVKLLQSESPLGTMPEKGPSREKRLEARTRCYVIKQGNCSISTHMQHMSF
jgi:hypothetical protein